MSAIFISHSSHDNRLAEQMKDWLEEQGHTSVFLDFDPESGLRAGSDWEEALYHKLRQCQAVIALLSPSWLMSKWCFAEFVQAREKGKAIFPVKVKPCDATSVVGGIQHIDLTAHSDEGYRRLATGLRERGLDPLDVFDLDPKRPPYPGLLAFQQADAALFFGRGKEVINGLEMLDSLRRQGRGTPRFVLFLGASGSGKSSLVRAGLIPRLRKTPSMWLPMLPFRPQDDPLEELALALADTFQALDQPRNSDEIGQALKAAAAQDPADGKVLLSLARELSMASKQREAMVVLTIDQAEELFGYSTPDAATRFLRLLRATLEGSNQHLMTIATLRSDFLGEFQTHRGLHDQYYDHDFAYQAIPVNPMPERNFVEIIRGPARLAGLRLEDGLVEAMVGDTGTRDALPLLAFTLRRLYDRYAQDGMLKICEYDEIGRLEGAIRAEAENILKNASPSLEEMDALRASFVPTMVRINADGGYARRRAFAEEMPRRAKSLLNRFVNQRLLVSDRDKEGRETLEVTHEALLRTWPQLKGWLAEDQDKLRLFEGLHRAAEDWDNSGRPSDLLVHRDGRLQDINALITTPRFSVQEHSLEKHYLDTCTNAQHAREAAEREEQERRVRDAEQIAVAQKKIARRTRIGLVVALVLVVAAVWQYWIARTAENQIKVALLNLQSAELKRQRQAFQTGWEGLRTLNPSSYEECGSLEASGKSVRRLYCDLKSIISFETVATLSPWEVFVDNGPHKKGSLSLEITGSGFGHYNPKFVDWLYDTAVPALRSEVIVEKTQNLYDNWLKKISRIYFLTYRELQTDPNYLDQEKKEYNNDRDHYSSLKYYFEESAHFGRFFAELGIEHCISFSSSKEECKNLDRKDIKQGQYDWWDDYNFWHARNAFAYWVRRSIDGTDKAFFRILESIMESYDPAFLEQMQGYKFSFWKELKNEE